MQQPMNPQMGQMVANALCFLRRLAAQRFIGNGNFTSCQPGRIGHARLAGAGLHRRRINTRGEGQHICWRILATKLQIEVADAVITGKQRTDFQPRPVERLADNIRRQTQRRADNVYHIIRPNMPVDNHIKMAAAIGLPLIG